MERLLQNINLMLDLLYRKRNRLIKAVVEVCVLLKYLRL